MTPWPSESTAPSATKLNAGSGRSNGTLLLGKWSETGMRGVFWHQTGTAVVHTRKRCAPYHKFFTLSFETTTCTETNAADRRKQRKHKPILSSNHHTRDLDNVVFIPVVGRVWYICTSLHRLGFTCFGLMFYLVGATHRVRGRESESMSHETQVEVKNYPLSNKAAASLSGNMAVQ